MQGKETFRVYEGRPLHEIGWEDLEGFLHQGRPEGTRLDYKGRWDPAIARDACAMANTSGGDVIVGVKEIEREDRKAGKTHLPNPDEPLVPEFFEGLLGPDPSYDRAKRGNPPTLAVAIRPRRVTFSFAFDSALDTKMQDLSMDNDLTDNRLLRPAPEGIAMQDPPSGTPRTRMEARKDATIRSAWALNTQVYDSEEREGRVRVRVLDFWDLALPVVRLVRFAGVAYALRRPGTEMEVALGLSGCQGCRARIGTHAPTKAGQIPDSPFYRQPEFAGSVVRTNSETGEPAVEDLVGLVRELSRFFRVSMPDDRLSEYV